MGPKALAQVLRRVDFPADPEKLLIGLDKADDAAVYSLTEEIALIQTLDFFTPVVDDPYLFGQIAAANALSDVYAMGGQPILAMNIVGFPSCLEAEILAQILQGGADKVAEAGASLCGGHTVVDEEPKYGLSVTGTVHPDKLLSNSGIKEGDLILLTKPLGTGVMVSAIKGGFTESDENNPAVKSMLTLNNIALKYFDQYQINACTDVTGFGLIGHLLEMSENSSLQLKIDASEIPIFAGVRDFAESGLLPAGAYKNRDNYQEFVSETGKRDQTLYDLMYDPQTSGGLLISVAEADAAELLIDLYAEGLDVTVIAKAVKGEKGVKIEWK
ncbi:selenophosphate synthase [Halanaerobium congolense]|jgi:selenide,water dikinase|uniref:Selenide, water dikinase n=2 Tax=Halanaerobium congolense TaxID=54121 RepID=A0A1G8IA16_9FIRM|nr:MAG: selenide, water dikinase [Halanaerobium sp.]SDI15702.1 selenophosphate synthase [Halanaerobium congolense]SES74489.1 selenophosphate synthase [Halanaerobium congolense]